MTNDFLPSLAGTSVAIAGGLVAFRYLATKLIEQRLAATLENHKHGLNARLAEIQADLARVGDVLSRRNEREFAVIEGAWERMIVAFGNSQSFDVMRRAPAFALKAEREALETIERLPFDEEQKAMLRTATHEKRDAIYERIDLARRYGLSYAAWVEFKNYLSTRQIFVATDIYSRFVSVRDQIYAVIVTVELDLHEGASRIPTRKSIELGKSLRGIDAEIESLGSRIQHRFGFDNGGG